MKPVKALAVALGLLVGAEGSLVTAASAAPLLAPPDSIYQQGLVTPVAERRMRRDGGGDYWRYNRHRHGERYRHRTDRHRFRYGGFYYSSPFWLMGPGLGLGYGYPGYDYGYYGRPGFSITIAPWSEEWYEWCRQRYRSFDPRTGRYFTGKRWVMCRVY